MCAGEWRASIETCGGIVSIEGDGNTAAIEGDGNTAAIEGDGSAASIEGFPTKKRTSHERFANTSEVRSPQT